MTIAFFSAAVRAWRWTRRGFAGAVLIWPISSCQRTPSVGPPPRASFLVVAGDSTFWVESAAGRVTVRRSPLLLTQFDGRFHELYLADDDRSYFNAVIVGQRIYRRDLLTGDSAVVLEDSTLAAIAREYAAAHPHEPRLAPDDEAAEEPLTYATADVELLDALGPFLTIEQHLDIDTRGVRDQHVTRRGVLDVRTGRAVRVSDLAGPDEGARVMAVARRQLSLALDSVRAANDDRARRAVATLTGFTFDSLSFSLADEGGAPAVAFLVPGSGARAGGFALPLEPVRIAPGAWWSAVQPTVSTASTAVATWPGSDYAVLAREDSSGDRAQVIVRVSPNEWPVMRVPSPVRRIYRLSNNGGDSAVVRALSRAFDESSLYSGEARTAAQPHPRLRLPVRDVENSIRWTGLVTKGKRKHLPLDAASAMRLLPKRRSEVSAWGEP